MMLYIPPIFGLIFAFVLALTMIIGGIVYLLPRLWPSQVKRKKDARKPAPIADPTASQKLKDQRKASSVPTNISGNITIKNKLANPLIRKILNPSSFPFMSRTHEAWRPNLKRFAAAADRQQFSQEAKG